MSTEHTTDRPTEHASAEDDLRSAAVRSLRRKRDFLQHLASYVIVNGMLVTAWVVVGLTSHFWFPWPIFPIVGWGVGIAFHAWAVFGPASRPPSDETVEREMRRLGRR
jgi:hypothetical protein